MARRTFLLVLVWLQLLVPLLSYARARSGTSVVSISQGKLRGVIIGNTSVYANIPYAAPPVKELRWRPPQRPSGWSGVRDATSFGPQCRQPSGAGVEDCLQLNVFTPLGTTPSSKLPVMVWIHGGAFQTGSAVGFTLQNMTNYLEGQVVAVSVNYRLNIFGFLGSENLRQRSPDGGTGNYGIQDQRAALQWVQENIHAFGGDKDKVTIFGESAGAGSVTNHLVQRKSFPFFRAAIMVGFERCQSEP